MKGETMTLEQFLKGKSILDKIKELEGYCDELEKFMEYVRDEKPDVLQSNHGTWVKCKDELPPVGVNVILCFKDTFHIHPSWPKKQVMAAWICNVDKEHPKGEWAIEGRLGNYVVEIDDGIAWMPMPEPCDD